MCLTSEKVKIKQSEAKKIGAVKPRTQGTIVQFLIIIPLAYGMMPQGLIP